MKRSGLPPHWFKGCSANTQTVPGLHIRDIYIRRAAPFIQILRGLFAQWSWWWVDSHKPTSLSSPLPSLSTGIEMFPLPVRRFLAICTFQMEVADRSGTAQPTFELLYLWVQEHPHDDVKSVQTCRFLGDWAGRRSRACINAICKRLEIVLIIITEDMMSADQQAGPKLSVPLKNWLNFGVFHPWRQNGHHMVR